MLSRYFPGISSNFTLFFGYIPQFYAIFLRFSLIFDSMMSCLSFIEGLSLNGPLKRFSKGLITALEGLHKAHKSFNKAFIRPYNL